VFLERKKKGNELGIMSWIKIWSVTKFV